MLNLGAKYQELTENCSRKHAYQYAEWQPSVDLADMVACFWFASQTDPGSSQTGSRIIPDGCMDLIFDHGADHSEGALFLSGTMTTGRLFSLAQPFKLWGIRLTPTGWLGLFDMPACEINDHHLDVAGFPERVKLDWPLSIPPTRNPLCQVRRLEEWLRHRRRQLPDWAKALQGLIRHIWLVAGRTTPTLMASHLGYSRRKLERLFAQGVGLSPAQYLNVVRIRMVIARLETQSQIDFAELAYSLGFCDQSHFIRVFKRHVDITPGHFLKEIQGAANVQYGRQILI